MFSTPLSNIIVNLLTTLLLMFLPHIFFAPSPTLNSYVYPFIKLLYGVNVTFCVISSYSAVPSILYLILLPILSRIAVSIVAFSTDSLSIAISNDIPGLAPSFTPNIVPSSDIPIPLITGVVDTFGIVEPASPSLYSNTTELLQFPASSLAFTLK
ncbi:MAG: hypothetical protein BWY95_02245 [Bacteroidetes bacterium ADurb.BinA104]|nr:MAG: hypothetical protein BWY95_02245 [Bacteroidetes bacterium ADurb.BinA104]